MKAKVISGFYDMKDNGHHYKVGDDFPRQGAPEAATTPDRLDVLKSKNNAKERPFIKAANDYDSLTVKELKAEADRRGLDYLSKAKKAELVALLEEAGSDGQRNNH